MEGLFKKNISPNRDALVFPFHQFNCTTDLIDPMSFLCIINTDRCIKPSNKCALFSEIQLFIVFYCILPMKTPTNYYGTI